MGQLDEAIRAHLELKRKHGASEEELQAEEQEALGPVRRELPVQPQDPAEDFDELDMAAEGEPALAPDSAGDPAAGAYDDGVPDVYDEPLEDLPPEAFHEPVDPLAEPGFDPAYEEPATTAGFIEEAGAEGPVPPLEPLPPEPAAGDTPPRGFDPVEDVAPVEGEEGEDVLEETPEFLQETPEHDRLWFEQKPPRDFDFDE